MNDLFRAIFGMPPKDQYGKRMDETPPDGYRNNFTNNREDDIDDKDGYDDDMRINRGGGFFDFSVFNDPTEVHRHFERLVNEMNKAFGLFGFDASTSISWEDENKDMSPCNENPCQRTENLRNLYLKQPEDVCTKDNQECNRVNVTFGEPGTSDNLSSDIQVTYPRMFSKSVFIQRVQRPDGSVETIKKVCDHTGKEETTITQSNVNDPLLPPQDNQPTPDDSSGISILRKFFSF